jgi:hypothetical protein
MPGACSPRPKARGCASARSGPPQRRARAAQHFRRCTRLQRRRGCLVGGAGTSRQPRALTSRRGIHAWHTKRRFRRGTEAPDVASYDPWRPQDVYGIARQRGVPRRQDNPFAQQAFRCGPAILCERRLAYPRHCPCSPRLVPERCAIILGTAPSERENVESCALRSRPRTNHLVLLLWTRQGKADVCVGSAEPFEKAREFLRTGCIALRGP